jgi:guanyl-specific ribonuclease Sa
MPPPDQALIHQLAPECENDLKGDYLQQIRGSYDKARRIPFIHLPSFEEIIAKTGAPGKLVLRLFAARQTLMDQAISNERLPDLLYQPEDGLPRVLDGGPDAGKSPWAEIQPGVIARLNVVEGVKGRNLFEFRVTEKAGKAASSNGSGGAHMLLASLSPQPQVQLLIFPVLEEILGLAGAIGEGELAEEELLIGYPIGQQAMQPMILAIQLILNNDNPNTGDKDKNNGAIKNIGDKPMAPDEADAIDDALTHIDKGEKPPYGWKWGESYNNDPTRGQELPPVDSNGNPIKYKEYYVKPEAGTNPPGSRRIVIGSDGSAYYTPDHYKTFWRLR